MVVRNRRKQFLAPSGKKIPKSKEVFTRSSKNFTKSIFRKVSISYESDHPHTYNAALTTLPRIFLL